MTLSRSLFSATLLLIFALFISFGCSSRMSAESMRTLALETGFDEARFHGRYFDIFEYLRVGDLRKEEQTLHVYLEGDGRAWLNRRTPASDPTPDHPRGFLFALKDTHTPVAYLARPCQYVCGNERRNCVYQLWTSARFSEPVVAELDSALDELLKQTHAKKLRLIGFSGGGALAVLLAARRDDVVSLVTVAGNLDHAAWTSMHGVSPLVDSLNPIDCAQKVQDIEQLHIVGSGDAIIPPSIARRFVKAMPNPKSARVVVIDGMGHHDDWTAALPYINQ